MKMKLPSRLISGSLLFLVGVLSLVSFARTGFAEDGVKPKLKIGVILPLSGPFADYGTATMNGMALARADTKIDSEVEFIFEDSQYDSKVALSAFQKLRSVDKVAMVFNFGTGTSQALAPVAESAQIPLVAMTSERALNIGKQYVFRFGCDAEDHSLLLLEYLRANKFKKVALLSEDVNFFQEVIRGIHRFATPDESFTDFASFTPNETDFKSVLLKLRKHNFDVLGVFISSSKIIPFFSQKEQLGIKTQVFGENTLDSRSDIKRVGSAIKGTVFPTYAYVESFSKRYIDQYNVDAQLPMAALGHDFVIMLSGVVTQPGDFESMSLVEKIRRSKSFIGASGEVKYIEAPGAGAIFAIPVMLQQVTETGVVNFSLR